MCESAVNKCLDESSSQVVLLFQAVASANNLMEQADHLGNVRCELFYFLRVGPITL